jgi:histone-lysine N-methyltransferase SETMAR
MDVLMEQRVCIKICQKLGKTATETYEMLQQAFGETALSRSKTFEWKKARKVRSNVKTMLMAFFDAEGLMHHEFLPQRQTMIQNVYIPVLQLLRDAVCRKRPRRWSSVTWLLHHDNAPYHAALSVREFLAKHSILVVPHPPYSPDLAPCDFFLFPRLKITLKGGTISRCRGDKLNTTRQLQAIPKQAYQACIEKWKDRWNRCIQSGGSYFEGYNFK